MLKRMEGAGSFRRSRSLPRPIAASLLLIVGIAACEEPVPSISGEEPFMVSDSLGITLADNFVQEWTLEEEPRLGDPPALRIGEEGSGVDLWGIHDVVGLDDGGFLIGMNVGREVLLVDSLGQVSGRVQATGEGPGEFRRLRDLAVRPRGGFGGYDAQLQRVVMFDEGGQVDRSVTIDARGGPLQRRLIGFLGDDAMLFGEEQAPEPAARSGSVVVDGDLVVYSPDGQPRDTLMSLPFREYHRFTGREAGAAALPSEMHLPLASRAFVRVHDGRIYVAHGSAYEIRVMDPSGALEMLIRYRGSLRPFDSAHREDMMHRMGQNIPNAVRAEWDRRMEALPWPTFFPAIEALEIGGDGRVWVCGHRQADMGTHDEDPLLCRWSVFESDGRMLGSVFSGSWDVADITGEVVLKRSQGEMGQEVVEAFTLGRNP